MQKLLLSALLALAATGLFAQQKDNKDLKQYMLIVRYNTDAKPDPATIKDNMQHWGAFIGGLAQEGKLVTGLRPAQEGRTISGKDKAVKEGPYVANNDIVSSFFVVKAADLDDATTIAKKCPIYELGGSVEIRAVMNN
ncbi:YciI family protein [Chitinophaga vietnamensis]|uniref:YciI family protein n=1 Tax=Chitinophaga vietnamensis TaxID=2593957 RepID=UPI001375CCA5|nr:YciI family protein [Chitinophaga vietnamensis]